MFIPRCNDLSNKKTARGKNYSNRNVTKLAGNFQPLATSKLAGDSFTEIVNDLSFRANDTSSFNGSP